jgi:hypothetical protein
MEETGDDGAPLFEVGQAVLVDQGLTGQITAVARGPAPGIRDLPPKDTWLYTVRPEGRSAPQTDIPEHNLMARNTGAQTPQKLAHLAHEPNSGPNQPAPNEDGLRTKPRMPSGHEPFERAKTILTGQYRYGDSNRR